MDGFDREHVWNALEAGRAYVSFDWICDPSGFVYEAEESGQKWPLGSKIPFREGLKLFTTAPLEAKVRLIRNGELIQEALARKMTFDVKEPGVYRVEYWLPVGDRNVPGSCRIRSISDPGHHHQTPRRELPLPRSDRGTSELRGKNDRFLDGGDGSQVI